MKKKNNVWRLPGEEGISTQEEGRNITVRMFRNKFMRKSVYYYLKLYIYTEGIAIEVIMLPT